MPQVAGLVVSRSRSAGVDAPLHDVGDAETMELILACRR